MNSNAFNPEQIYQQLQAVGQEWANAKARYEELDEAKKSVLAELYESAERKTVKDKEQAALASKVYRDYIAALAVARHEYLIADVKWRNIQVLASMKQSEYATLREELKRMNLGR